MTVCSVCEEYSAFTCPSGQDKIMNFVHLGESVRVRVVECVPATGLLRLSMRLEEEAAQSCCNSVVARPSQNSLKISTAFQDLPELFMGKPRPYSIHDIEQGMKASG